MTTVDYDWRRYALISELAAEMKARGFTFGKTALQKFVYFLQELHGVQAGYEFSLYTYGPFSSSLLGDLDNAKELGAVDVRYLSGTGGYDIRPGANTGIREKARAFIEGNAGAIKSVIEEFGALWAKDLELRATIVYVERDCRSSGEKPVEDLVIETVHGLKPHFSHEVIRKALHELEERGYVAAA